MGKEVIETPIPSKFPYSAAIRAGDFIFVSGQNGFQDPDTGDTIEGIKGQTTQCIENIKQILKYAGSSLDDVVKVTIILRNEEDFHEMNQAYQKCFPKKQPARTTAISNPPLSESLAEIECIAYSPSNKK